MKDVTVWFPVVITLTLLVAFVLWLVTGPRSTDRDPSAEPVRVPGPPAEDPAGPSPTS